MTLQTITFDLPENLYFRLQNAAQGMKRPLNEVLRRAVEVGVPPSWDDAPAAFQADLAALDRLDDEALWNLARSVQDELNWNEYQTLLDKNAEGKLSAGERVKLDSLRAEADGFALRKAQAAALLRWRGRPVALPELPATVS